MHSLHALPARGGSASASASFTAEQPNQRSTQIAVERRYIVHVEPYPLPLRPLNSQYMRPKQVSEPLNEAVRARLIGNCPCDALPQTVGTAPAPAIAKPDYSTSGSDHGIDSPILTDMRFLEEEEEQVEECSDSWQDNESDAESPGAQLYLEEQLHHILERVCPTVKAEAMVLQDVKKAIGMADAPNVSVSDEEESHSKSYLRRFVMSKLRDAGYNAGICKSRWEQTNGNPAGEYEVIDVVGIEDDSTSKCDTNRLLVDIDFRAQFEIARPTAEYAGLVEQIPALFVGDADKLRDIIRTMCEAAKLSLRAKGMPLPPWRKYRYVAAKWLGPYKRTTNARAVACMDERQLLLREFSGIASFRGIRCHWDAAFTHQLELHFGKAVREASRTAHKKMQSQRQPRHEQPSSNDLFLTKPKSKSGLNAIRTSGLAAALAEAAAHRGRG